MAHKTIQLIIKDFDPARGGGERFAVNLALALKGAGLPLQILARQISPSLIDQFNIQKITPSCVSLDPQSAFNKAIQPFIKGATSCVLALTPIVNADILRLGGGILGYWEGIKYQGTLGKIRRLSSLNHQGQKSLEKKTVTSSRLTHLVVNSSLVADQVQQFYPELKAEISHIPNPVWELKDKYIESCRRDGMELLKERNIPIERPCLLFASNNFERKGLRELIKALATNENAKETQLIVLGRGKTEKMFKLCNEEGLSSRVFFIGSVNSPQPYYAIADCFVLPTRYDPCSNACLEALAMGVPVITTAQNGASAYLENGGGYVLPGIDLITELGEALIWLQKARMLNMPLTDYARLAVDNLTWTRILPKWIELIEDVWHQ